MPPKSGEKLVCARLHKLPPVTELFLSAEKDDAERSPFLFQFTSPHRLVTVKNGVVIEGNLEDQVGPDVKLRCSGALDSTLHFYSIDRRPGRNVPAGFIFAEPDQGPYSTKFSRETYTFYALRMLSENYEDFRKVAKVPIMLEGREAFRWAYAKPYCLREKCRRTPEQKCRRRYTEKRGTPSARYTEEEVAESWRKRRGPMDVVDLRSSQQPFQSIELDRPYHCHRHFYCMGNLLYFFKAEAGREVLREVTDKAADTAGRRIFEIIVPDPKRIGVYDQNQILYIISKNKLLIIEKEKIVRRVDLRDYSKCLDFESTFKIVGILRRLLIFTVTEAPYAGSSFADEYKSDYKSEVWSVELPARYRAPSEMPPAASDDEDEVAQGNAAGLALLRLLLEDEEEEDDSALENDDSSQQTAASSGAYGYNSSDATAAKPIRSSFSSQFQRNYGVDRVLGAGTYGIVFAVRQQMVNNRQFAIKRIAIIEREDGMALATKEIGAMHRLMHKNIVKFHDTWFEEPPSGWQKEQDDILMKRLGVKNEFPNPYTSRFVYIVMELCAFALDQWLEENEERDAIKMKQWIKELVAGVAHIHACGLIHRDLKPSNILLTCGEVLKVGDLGLATDFSPRSDGRPGFRTRGCGTRMYMAPEQMSTATYTQAVDVFSMGLIGVEMLLNLTAVSKEEVFNNYREGIDNNLFPGDPAAERFFGQLTSVLSSKRPKCLAILTDEFLDV